MNTERLSTETLQAVLQTAEKFDHDLTHQFDLLVDKCNDDDDYLTKAKNLIANWRRDPDFVRKMIFVEKKKPSDSSFDEVLTKIELNINRVQSIPKEERNFSFQIH